MRMVSSIARVARLFIKPPRSLLSIAGQMNLSCPSQQTLHSFCATNITEHFKNTRSSKHIENSIWAEKLATGGSADLKNTLGWGGFGATGREDHGAAVPGSTWEHELRPSKDPAPLSPLDSVIGQVEHLSSSLTIEKFLT